MRADMWYNSGKTVLGWINARRSPRATQCERGVAAHAAERKALISTTTRQDLFIALGCCKSVPLWQCYSEHDVG